MTILVEIDSMTSVYHNTLRFFRGCVLEKAVFESYGYPFTFRHCKFDKIFTIVSFCIIKKLGFLEFLAGRRLGRSQLVHYYVSNTSQLHLAFLILRTRGLHALGEQSDLCDLAKFNFKPQLQVNHCLAIWLQIWFYRLL